MAVRKSTTWQYSTIATLESPAGIIRNTREIMFAIGNRARLSCLSNDRLIRNRARAASLRFQDFSCLSTRMWPFFSKERALLSGSLTGGRKKKRELRLTNSNSALCVISIARNVSNTIWIVCSIRSRKSWFDRQFRSNFAYYCRLKRLSSRIFH